MPHDPNFRLFFALWPSDALRVEMEKSARPLAESGGGRAVRSANFHITLAFLGEVGLPLVGQALNAGARTSGRPFELSLDRIEFWPQANVLCLAPGKVPAELPALADRLRCNLLEQRFRLKRQRFRAHVTLARKVPGRRPALSIRPLQWSVDDFVLVRSQPAPGGSEYSVLARWPLQGVDTMR